MLYEIKKEVILLGNYPDRNRRRRPPRRRTCPRGTVPYYVRREETMSSIARKFDTTVSELRRINPDVRPGELRRGQRICVPEY